MQYSITNVNAFILLIGVGYSLYMFIDKNKSLNLKSSHDNPDNIDMKYSPIQLISQLKGYFYINPYIALSLAITLFSFVGIPPLTGFFAKQMVLSSALDKGYIFMVLVAILTSAISAYYYLAVVKEIYFSKSDYVLNPVLKGTHFKAYIYNATSRTNIVINTDNIKLSGSVSISASVLTLVLLLFVLAPQE
jgi:NADH-ubiquinone oxidoreductase chain 2